MTAPVLTLIPDGRQPVLERLSFRTDVPVARDGSEPARRSSREYPRYRYEWLVAAATQSPMARAAVLDWAKGVPQDWLVPLWPHASKAPEMPSTGTGVASLLPYIPNDRWVGFNAAWEATTFNGGIPSLAQPIRTIYPVAAGRLVDVVKATHSTGAFADVTVAFELLNHCEDIGAYSGPVGLDGKPAPDLPINWNSRPSEEFSRVSEMVDSGVLWAEDVMHTERTLSVTVSLMNKAALLAFRQFIFYTKGRRHAFWLQPPSDAAPSLWRLNSDTVELSYFTPSLAQSALTFKQVSE